MTNIQATSFGQVPNVERSAWLQHIVGQNHCPVGQQIQLLHQSQIAVKAGSLQDQFGWQDEAPINGHTMDGNNGGLKAPNIWTLGVYFMYL